MGSNHGTKGDCSECRRLLASQRCVLIRFAELISGDASGGDVVGVFEDNHVERRGESTVDVERTYGGTCGNVGGNTKYRARPGMGDCVWGHRLSLVIDEDAF